MYAKKQTLTIIMQFQNIKFIAVVTKEYFKELFIVKKT